MAKKRQPNAWTKFVKARMSKYMKSEGSHSKAMKRISKEYKEQNKGGVKTKVKTKAKVKSKSKRKKASQWKIGSKHNIKGGVTGKNYTITVDNNVWGKGRIFRASQDGDLNVFGSPRISFRAKTKAGIINQVKKRG